MRQAKRPVEPALAPSGGQTPGGFKLGHYQLSNGATFPPDPDAGKLPAYKHATSVASTTFRAMISVDSLRRVCDAIGSEQVIIEFTDAAGLPAPVRVIPTKGTARGYMMAGKITD